MLLPLSNAAPCRTWMSWHPGTPGDSSSTRSCQYLEVADLATDALLCRFSASPYSQGLWSAPTAKPTTLLLLNADEVISALHRWRVTVEIPKGDLWARIPHRRLGYHEAQGISSFNVWSTWGGIFLTRHRCRLQRSCQFSRQMPVHVANSIWQYSWL